jgi:mono/diheme cytochrome c family protein
VRTKLKWITGGAIAAVAASVVTLFTAAYVATAPATVARAAADSNPYFEQYCIGCHGPDARGIENAGVNLVDSAFIATTSDQGLVEFLKVGRLPDDPANRTGRPMPGFSWVPESELKSVAAFLKSISGKN